MTPTIPSVVIALMLTGTTSKEHFWYPTSLWLTVAECREHAPPKGTTDAHNIPVEWKCVPYKRSK